MLQLGCSTPSAMSSTPASPSLFSPTCRTFKCLFVLRAEPMALQQAVVSPHSLTLQAKSKRRSRQGPGVSGVVHCLTSASQEAGQWEQRNQSFPRSLRPSQPPACSTLPKQHLSHSLYLGCLSRSVL